MITSFKSEYAFLSNFAPAKVVLDGLEYPTVEHAYQAAKTTDQYSRRDIKLLDSPGKAKRYGRSVIMRLDWHMVKDRIMMDLLKQKFKQEPYRTLLKNTGNQKLIEGNTWGDRYWGCEWQAGQWVGLNRLGYMLMYIRSEI